MAMQIVWNYGALVAALVFCGFLSSLLLFKRWAHHHHESFPPSPPAWPIIGHLHLLASLPHQTLAALSTQYGPIIGLRLGSQPAVVVSSPALAREFLLNHDKTFANRPPFELSSSLHYGYNNGIAFSSYGPQSRKLRKLCTLELFTARRLQELQYVREEEVAGLLERIREASQQGGGTEAVDLGRYVGEMASNSVSRLLQSKRLSGAAQHGGDILQDLIKEAEHEVAPTVGDLFPWLKWVDVLRKKRMKQIHGRLDKIFDSILMERRQAMMEGNPHELPQDFLQVLLSKELGYTLASQEGLTPHEIKGIMLDMLGPGIATTIITLEWAIAELLRNPDCLLKLQNEIDTVIGKGKQICELDLPKLNYLKNTVKEVFRLHPAIPLLIPRISFQACKVGNYMLPINTQLFVNVFAIGRDPQVWGDKANTFLPQRFDGKDMDLKGQHYELLPFGSGRRICPGLPLGLSIMECTLANLVSFFDWELPQGITPSSMDMSEKRGITSGKATPLLAIPKPRF